MYMSAVEEELIHTHTHTHKRTHSIAREHILPIVVDHSLIGGALGAE